jgi:IclR family transcriptional regulator, pca regulon regulatory protein
MAADPDFMTSLARGLAVINAFSQQRPQQSISQLSVKTSIPRAAVRRCLLTLSRLGYVGHDPERRTFMLRPKVLNLGYAYLSSIPLVAMAQPVLDRLSQRLHESSSVAVLEDGEIAYIARSRATRRIMSVDLGIGSRLPAYCTSLGRVLLAGLAADELKAYLTGLKSVRHTPFTVVGKEGLRAAIDAARRDGFSIVDQELEMGLRSIAVPITDIRGHVIAALNASTNASILPLAQFQSNFLPALRHAASELNQNA